MNENICYMLSYKDYYDIRTKKLLTKGQVNKGNYYKFIAWYLNYEAKLDLRTQTSEGITEFDVFGIAISYRTYNSFTLCIANKVFQIDFEGSIPNKIKLRLCGCEYICYVGMYKKIAYLGHHASTVGWLNYGFKPYKYEIKFWDMKDWISQYNVFILGVIGVVLSDDLKPLALVTIFTVQSNQIVIERIIYSFDVHFRKLQLLLGGV